MQITGTSALMADLNFPSTLRTPQKKCGDYREYGTELNNRKEVQISAVVHVRKVFQHGGHRNHRVSARPFA
jgi:hypothetical protein